jgi:predicted alpha/beta-fold hydrolase
MSGLSSVPRFDPHPLLRDGHAQTIAGAHLPGRRVRLAATEHRIDLDDGDRLSVWESIPPGWQPGAPAAVLVHGLAGSTQSSYVQRLAWRLTRMGVRVVRMNLRGAGTGFGLARATYHAGRTGDVRAVVDWLARRLLDSPIALIGFSLGGNLVLKLAADAADEPIAGLDCVLAASPPVDLAACSAHLRRPAGRLYNSNLVRALRRAIKRHHACFPDLGPPGLGRVRTLAELDDRYTAPRNGFSGAAEYYERSSAAPSMSRINLPGLIVQAEDDPFIPPEPIRRVQCPLNLALELLPSGGHLGFISRRRWAGDRRWLDARLASWLAGRWAARPLPAAGAPGAP